MDRNPDTTDESLIDIIPILCVVDVFLSSHFSPFRGHYLLPTQSALRKGSGRGIADLDDKLNRKEGDEDCSSFHSVFSEDESEMDRALDSGGHTPTKDISNSISLKTHFDKVMGSSALKGEGDGIGGAGAGAHAYDSAPYAGSSSSGSDSESSVPTYLELCSNTAIAPSSFSNYSVPSQGLSSSTASASKGTVNAAMSQRNKRAKLYHMAWRKAQPCDLDSREILLTVDYGGTLKVWSARRRELIIPVTTATRSISGAGTSCIVTGSFQTHINPDVSLLYEGLVSRLVWQSSVSAVSRDASAVHVGWMEHATCPASEQRHSSSSPLTLEPAAVTGSRSNGTANPSTFTSTSSSNTNRAQHAGAADRKGEADSSFPATGQGQGQGQGYDSRGFHDSAVSGMWISILAPCDLIGDTYALARSDSTGVDGICSDFITRGDASYEKQSSNYQYSFVCMNSNADSQHTEAAVYGRGAIVHVGPSLFPPSASIKLRNFFSQVSQSFAVGRFSSSGLGYPFSVDIVTILKDLETQGQGQRCKGSGEGEGRLSANTLRNRLIKVINGISERTVDQKIGTRTAPGTGTGTVESKKVEGDGKGFIVSPTTIYDVLYSRCVTEGAGVAVDTKGGSARGGSPVCVDILPTIDNDHEDLHQAGAYDQATARPMVSTSFQRALPFSTDSMAGLMQTNLTRFDSMECTYRVSGPALALPPSSSSTSVPPPTHASFTSILPPTVKNIEILSRQGITELHQQHQPLEAVTYEILPCIPQTYGLVDMTIGPSFSPSASTESVEYSVIRAIVVPFDSLKKSSGKAQRPAAQPLCRTEGHLLVVLQSCKSGMRLLLWTDRDVRGQSAGPSVGQPVGQPLGGGPSLSPSDSTTADSASAPSGAGGREVGCRGGHDAPSGGRTYTVKVTPDPQYGLGLRLDVRDGIVVVDSFKRHPHTDAHLACEACQLIGAHDELVSINEHVLKGANLPSVIGTIRSVVHASNGNAVTLVLQSAPPSSSRTAQDSSALWKDKSRTSEESLFASPYYFWQYHSCIELTQEQLGVQSPAAADIGYDMLRGDIILGTLSTSNGSDCSTGEVANVLNKGSSSAVQGEDKGRVLSLFHLALHSDDSQEAVRCSAASQHFLSGCDTDSGSGNDRPPILQLWKDMDPFSASLSRPGAVYISLISHPCKPIASDQSSRGRERSKSAGLTACCSITIVKMQCDTRIDDGYTYSQQQGVESLISVVTSTVSVSNLFAPVITSSRQPTAASSSISYRESPSSNDKDCNMSSEELSTGYQLLLSPVRISGEQIFP